MLAPHTFTGLAYTEGLYHLFAEFNLEQQNAFNGQCVYVWLRGDECLYVGSSKETYKRMFHGHHVIHTEWKRVEPTDTFRIHFGKGREYEQELITSLKPRYNKQLSCVPPPLKPLPMTPAVVLALQKLDLLKEQHARITS